MGATASFAADSTSPATAQPTKAAASGAKSAVAATPKKPAKAVKLVDINSAKLAELKKLPGITEAEAAQILAHRPYGSKAWLVSHNVIQANKYPAIKDLVIAKQPFKDAAQNAALYAPKTKASGPRAVAPKATAASAAAKP